MTAARFETSGLGMIATALGISLDRPIKSIEVKFGVDYVPYAIITEFIEADKMKSIIETIQELRGSQ